MRRIRTRTKPLSRWVGPRVGLILALALGTLGTAPGDAWAGGGKRCKGTKQFYAGACRYPEEIAKLKAEEQRRRDAAVEAQRREQERQRQQEVEAREAEDAKACVAARKADTRAAWEKYVSERPEGMCRSEADGRLQALANAPPETSPPEPVAPAEPPAPAAPPPAASEAGWLGLSPLVWIGFGAAAAGAVTWAVAGGITMARTSDLEDTCPNELCPPEHEADLDRANVAAHVTTVGVVLTAAGTAVGVVGLLLGPSDDDEAASSARIPAAVVQPVVGLGHVGLVVSF